MLGLSPWRTPVEVWLDKRGELPDREPTEPQWWGTALEPVIADRYAMERKRTVWNPERMYRHPRYDFLLANPDRLTYGPPALHPDAGLECKTESAFAGGGWGEPGTDQVPHHYLLQCAHYMAVTGLERWDVALLVGGSDFRAYTVHRDRALEDHIIERLVAWWRTHMEGGVEPDLDGSAGVRDWLHRRYPREVQLEPLQATVQAEVLAKRLAEARVQESAGAAERAAAENNLKALMGEHARMLGSDWHVSWKAAKGRTVVDWEAVAKKLAEYNADHARLAVLTRAHTTEAPAVRRFLFTVNPTDRRELKS